MSSGESSHDDDLTASVIHADAAAALALGRRRSRQLDPAAREYLHKQSRMLDLQMEDLHEQRLLTVNALKRRQLSERLKLSLLVMSIFMGLVAGVLILGALWHAHSARDVVIEPIGVPPDVSAQGMTSTVLASQLLDKLRYMQEHTDSARAPNTYADNWSGDVKIEIPETGVSIGEMLRVMRQWLGHDTHVTGEMYRTPAGFTLTARVGDHPGQSFSGGAQGQDALVQKAAESIFGQVEPYRYAVYLAETGRGDQSLAVLRAATQQGSRVDRAWAFIGVGGELGGAGDLRRSVEQTRRGLSLDPNLAAGWRILEGAEEALGHDEASLHAAEHVVHLLHRSDRGGMTRVAAAQALKDAMATVAEHRGDFAQAAKIYADGLDLERYQQIGSAAVFYAAADRRLVHLPTAPPPPLSPADDPEAPLYEARYLIAGAEADGKWNSAIPALEKLQSDSAHQPGVAYRAQLWPTEVWPWLAFGYAVTGRFDEANALILRTPADCYICLVNRGRIAAIQHRDHEADAAFAKAIETGPSLPFAHGYWARWLDERGDRKSADRQFRLAVRLGPEWAQLNEKPR